MLKIYIIGLLVFLSACNYKNHHRSVSIEIERPAALLITSEEFEGEVMDNKPYYTPEEITASTAQEKFMVKTKPFIQHLGKIKESTSSNIILDKPIQPITKTKQVREKKGLDKNLVLSLVLLGIGIAIIAVTILFITNSVLYYVCIGLAVSLLYSGISNLVRSVLFQN